jgi:hypothetical protein
MKNQSNKTNAILKHKMVQSQFLSPINEDGWHQKLKKIICQIFQTTS